MRATWKGRVLAESNATVVIENNQYFPPDSVVREYLRPSERRSTCPWKGEAHYYDLVVDGEVNRGAAWTYPNPKEEAAEIAGHVAFWKGVDVTESCSAPVTGRHPTRRRG